MQTDKPIPRLINADNLREYIELRHSTGFDYSISRDGITITWIRAILHRCAALLGSPHRAMLFLVLRFLIAVRTRRGAKHVEARDIYRLEIQAIDIWTIGWPFFHMLLYLGQYHLAVRLQAGRGSLLDILAIFILFTASMYRAADIVVTLLRLHLAQGYTPHSSPRAVVGTLCHFLDVCVSFAIAFIVLRVIIGSQAFAGSLDLLASVTTPLYFSFVTITTLGYGDILPVSSVVQGMVIIELLTGLVFVVVIFQHVVAPHRTRDAGFPTPSLALAPISREATDSAPTMQEQFAVAFHDRFRHDEKFLVSLFVRYADVFRDSQPVLDVACGRGEFLHAMRVAGVAAHGLDINPLFVKMCKEKNLDVVEGSWVSVLEGTPDNSLGGIFSAQFVEHMESQDLLEFVSLANRKLRIGGVIVIETLVPNLSTLLRKFYVDFTHRSPINPGALAFMLEFAGFSQIRTSYYNVLEPALKHATNLRADGDGLTVVNRNFDRINELVFGPDYYAVLGTKTAMP